MDTATFVDASDEVTAKLANGPMRTCGGFSSGDGVGASSSSRDLLICYCNAMSGGTCRANY